MSPRIRTTALAISLAVGLSLSACGGDDDNDDASTAVTEEPGSGDAGTAENDETDGGGDSGIDPCALGQDAVEPTLAGATCEHTIDGIQDETAVWSRDGDEVLRVAVYAEEIDEFPTMEDEEANRHPVHDEDNTYEMAPDLGNRAWILTVPDGMEEGMTAHMETDRYMLITVNSTVLERADLVTTASAVLEDVAALG